VNDIVLKEIFTHNARGGADDDALRDARKREEVLRRISDELHWKSELYALAAAGRFPRAEDRIVENFAENIVEDIREFQRSGYPGNSIALKDISEAVAAHLQAEGIELPNLVLPPSIEELIDSGAERPDHIGQERWDKAVDNYYHRMTLENTPDEFINGGGDYDDEYYPPYAPDEGWGADDEDSGEETSLEIEMR
jgi:hypothetical protein